MSVAASKKTSISLSAHSARVLERNRFSSDRSARIKEMIARYDMLILQEREGVAHLIEDNFLTFVIGEWLEVYPIQLGLLTIVDTVYKDRKFDGFEVPEEAELRALMKQLKALSLTQQMALVEMIEANLA